MHVIRASAAQDSRVTMWVPRVTRISRNARLGKLPRVSAPRMDPTREYFFLSRSEVKRGVSRVN